VLIRGSHLSSLAQWLYKNFDSMHVEHLISQYLSTIGSDSTVCGPSLFSLNPVSDLDYNDLDDIFPKDTEAEDEDEDEVAISALL
jgi:hypothetical protein